MAPRRARRAPRRKSRAPRRAPRRRAPLVKVIKAVVRTEEKRMLETKYVAKDLLGAQHQPIKEVIVSGGSGSPPTGSTLIPVIPQLTVGSESHERQGTRVSPVSLKTQIAFNFDPDFAINWDGYVKVFFLTNKSVKDQSMTQEIVPGDLLDVGNGTSVDWTAGNGPLNNQLPIKNEYWNCVAQKTFKMSKNVASTTGSATNTYATNVGHSSVQQSFSLKLPQTLVYPDGLLTTYPTNHAIWLAMVYYASDGSSYNGNVIRATVRSHMYYKDA